MKTRITPERTSTGKTCTTCLVIKPFDAFGANRQMPDGLRYECKECRNAASRALPPSHPAKASLRENSRRRYRDPKIGDVLRAQGRARYRANPAKFSEAHRRQKLKREFGLTIEEWEAMFAAQNGRCAICGTDDFKGKRPHTDHDHATGKVRGLLCKRCNQGIGFFVDDPGLMRAAAVYIETRSTKKMAP